jgi:hypothetical protein
LHATLPHYSQDGNYCSLFGELPADYADVRELKGCRNARGGPATSVKQIGSLRLRNADGARAARRYTVMPAKSWLVFGAAWIGWTFDAFASWCPIWFPPERNDSEESLRLEPYISDVQWHTSEAHSWKTIKLRGGLP